MTGKQTTTKHVHHRLGKGDAFLNWSYPEKNRELDWRVVKRYWGVSVGTWFFGVVRAETPDVE